MVKQLEGIALQSQCQMFMDSFMLMFIQLMTVPNAS